MKTTVLGARVLNDIARRVSILARLRGVDKQDIVISGIQAVLVMAPESAEVERLMAEPPSTPEV